MELRPTVEQEGFAILPDILPRREIQSLIENIPEQESDSSRAGIRHALRIPSVAAMAKDPRLLGLARQILGETAVPFRATLFGKSPQNNWLVAWHQDKALPLRERRDTMGWGPWSVKDGVIHANAPASALKRVVALRLHLDDSVSGNGPLRVLPGTHKFGVLNDESVREVARDRPSSDCLVANGGVILMRPLLLHASSKSQSELPRRVLHIEYAASIKIDDGLELASC